MEIIISYEGPFPFSNTVQTPFSFSLGILKENNIYGKMIRGSYTTGFIEGP
jgi:hypothetical protein